MSILIKEAQQVLINNRKRGYTLPTNNKLYPAQWNWDSAFISIGYSYFNIEYAIKERSCVSFLTYFTRDARSEGAPFFRQKKNG